MRTRAKCHEQSESRWGSIRYRIRDTTRLMATHTAGNTFQSTLQNLFVVSAVSSSAFRSSQLCKEKHKVNLETFGLITREDTAQNNLSKFETTQRLLVEGELLSVLPAVRDPVQRHQQNSAVLTKKEADKIKFEGSRIQIRSWFERWTSKVGSWTNRSRQDLYRSERFLEVLDSKITIALKELLTAHFKMRVYMEEQKAQQDNQFLKGRQNCRDDPWQLHDQWNRRDSSWLQRSITGPVEEWQRARRRHQVGRSTSLHDKSSR